MVSSTGRDVASKVVTAGLTVGVLDSFGAIAHSLIIRGQARPIAIFQGIASVLIGEGAMSGGLTTASLGLAMHFCVALTWAAVYGVIYSRSGWLRRSPASYAPDPPSGSQGTCWPKSPISSPSHGRGRAWFWVMRVRRGRAPADPIDSNLWQR